MGSGGARIGVQVGFAKAGVAAGALAGNPMMGFQIGMMLGGVVGNLVFPDDPANTNQYGPKLADLTVQTSTYGNGIPLLYGTVRIAGNIIWSTKLIEHAHTTVEQAPGKGGSGPTTTTTTYTYSVSFAVSLCANEIIGIKRIWADDKLWFDFSNPPAGTAFKYELYKGTEDQGPSPAIEADKGVGNVPAFRGQAYIVFKDLDLTKFGNRVPNFHFEVICAGSEAITATHVITYDDHIFSRWWTRLAIDYETGYLWSTNSMANLMTIIDPELNIIKQFFGDMGTPKGIAYQPPYQYLDMPSPFEVGQQPEVKEMPPRMWSGSYQYGFMNVNGAAAYCVDTRTYHVEPNNNIRNDIPGSFAQYLQPTLGVVVVDARTIHVDQLNTEGKGRVHYFESDATAGYCYTVTIGPRDQEFALCTPQSTFNAAIGPYSLMNDAICGDSDMLYLYCVDVLGNIRAVDYDFNIAATRQDYVTIALFNRLLWDKFERKLYAIIVVNGRGRLIKYSEDLSVKHWELEAGTMLPPFNFIMEFVAFDIHPNTGALYALAQNLGNNWRLMEIDKTDGTILSTTEVLNTEFKIWQSMKIYPNSMIAYVAWVGSGGHTDVGIAKVPLIPGPTGTYPTLKTVVEDLSTRTGLSLSEIDAAPLAADTVTGYAIAQRMPARSAIEPLMAGYFFDAVESDYTAKFVKRGGVSIKTIPYDQTGAHADGADPTPRREVTRAEENDLPWQVDVNYMDVESVYKINVQYARRLIGQSKSVLQTNIAAVFTSTEAKRIAERMLYNTWIQRQSGKLRLSARHSELDPTDMVTFQDEDASTQLYRVQSAEYTFPNRMDLTLIEEDVSVYTQVGTGLDADIPTQTVPSAMPTIAYFLDMSIMGREADNDIGFYFAGTPAYGSGWPGAALYRADMGGDAYTAIETFPSTVTAGVAASNIPYEGSIP